MIELDEVNVEFVRALIRRKFPVSNHAILFCQQQIQNSIYRIVESLRKPVLTDVVEAPYLSELIGGASTEILLRPRTEGRSCYILPRDRSLIAQKLIKSIQKRHGQRSL